MSIFSAGDKFSVQAANLIRKGHASATEPTNPVTDEIYIDKSVTPRVWKQYYSGSFHTIGQEIPAAVNVFSRQIIADDNNPAIFKFKAPASITSCTIYLLGLNFPSWPYTELGQHSHDAGHIHAFSDDGNTGNYDLGTHKHSDDFYVASRDLGSHNHAGVTIGGGDTAAEDLSTHDHSLNGNIGYTDLGAHAHSLSVSGNTGAPSASGTWAVDNAGVDAGGITAAQKTNFSGPNLQVYATQDYWTVDWGMVWNPGGGDPNLTGLFNNGGTGEVDISGMIDVPGWWFMKFAINEADKGATFDIDIRIS